MGRKRSCSVCLDPGIATINSLIESGVTQRTISEQFPFSVSQISRHSRHLAPATADLTDAPASRDHALWLRRAEETFLRASADGDTKSAGQAISVAVRALTAMHKKQSEEAEARKAVTDDPFSVQSIDQSLRDFMKQRDAANDYPSAKAESLFIETPDFARIVFAVWRDRSLIPALLTACTNYIPERKSENVNANVGN